MRQKHTTQGSIFWFRPEHEICDYLDRVDSWLNLHPELLDWIDDDLCHHAKGRQGLSCDQVLRCALIKQYRQCSYRALSFLLADSLSFQQFARTDPFKIPRKSALQATISRIKDATWEKMNQLFVRDMFDSGFEPGDRLRIDSTVAESHILSPTDSKLLYDCLRVMVRVLKRTRSLTNVTYVNHSRRAKSNYFAAHCAKNDDSRYCFYKRLLKDVDKTRVSLHEALEVLKTKPNETIWVGKIESLLPLVAQVMDQTTRRVMEGESVPAEEKIVSIFEDHADIIKKGGRQVQFGHKINLTSGRTGIIYDVVIEDGNPGDSTRLLPMLERHKEIYGELPVDIAADGGYASQENLTASKEMGIDNVAFHKRVGLEISDMTGDEWLFRELRNFRAGIEAGISYLKRCFGLGRITWKGWDRFCASIHLSIFTHNLIRWARTPG